MSSELQENGDILGALGCGCTVFCVWLAVSLPAMLKGEAFGFLLFGSGLLFLTVARVRSRWSGLPARALETAVVAGICLTAFSAWRIGSARAFEHEVDSRIAEYAKAHDFNALIRAANHASSSLERQHSADALRRVIVEWAEEHSSEDCAAAARNWNPASVVHGFRGATQIIVWDSAWDRGSDGSRAEAGEDFETEKILDKTLIYNNGEGPLAVYLVKTHLEQVGTYEISKEPAYRKRIDVCVVKFDRLSDHGKLVAFTVIRGLPPAQERDVTQAPEYGDLGLQLKYWVCCGGIVEAVGNDDTGWVAKAIKDDPDLALVRPWGGPLLQSARSTEMAELLLAHGASVEGLTPIAFSKSMVEWLLAHGAQVNHKDEEGETPLIKAASGGPELVELLLAHGADVWARDKAGNTPLLRWAGSLELRGIGRDEAWAVADALLAHGADVNAAVSGETPLRILLNAVKNTESTERKRYLNNIAERLRERGGHE